MNLAHDSCPLCGARDLRDFEAVAYDSPLLGQRVSVRICDACDFAWQWPLARTSDDSKEFFQGQYEQASQGSYFDAAQRRKISGLQTEFIEGLGAPDRTLLDVGCGDGVFAVQASQAGWMAWGVDPAMPISPLPTEDASNPTLIKGALDRLDPRAQFSVVTLWDVVEHLPEPFGLLRQAWQHVRSGGWMVLETGNYQSFERLLAGPNWWGWQCDHRWYFAPPTLLKLLEPLCHEEVRSADRVLRPWSRGRRDYVPPSRLQTALSLLKSPWRRAEIMREHGTKRRAAARWPAWAGMPIFVLAIKKSAVQFNDKQG